MVPHVMTGVDIFTETIVINGVAVVILILDGTECPKSYRKSVLHLLKYRFPVYLGKFWDTQ